MITIETYSVNVNTSHSLLVLSISSDRADSKLFFCSHLNCAFSINLDLYVQQNLRFSVERNLAQTSPTRPPVIDAESAECKNLV